MNKNKIKMTIALVLTMSTIVMAGGCGNENTDTSSQNNEASIEAPAAESKAEDKVSAEESKISQADDYSFPTAAQYSFSSPKELVDFITKCVVDGKDETHKNVIDPYAWLSVTQNDFGLNFEERYKFIHEIEPYLDKGSDYINENYPLFRDSDYKISSEDVELYLRVLNLFKNPISAHDTVYSSYQEGFTPVDYDYDESKLRTNTSTPGHYSYCIGNNTNEQLHIDACFYENSGKYYFTSLEEIYYGDGSSSSDATPANSEEINSDETEKNFDNSWTGVYRYDDGKEGELLLISLSSYKVVRGTYVFGYDNGGYGSRDFTWYLRDQNEAVESFGNGDGTVIYYLKEGKITAQYPDGWWDDRDYIYICEADEARQQIKHTYFDNRTESTADSSSPATDGHHTPFYGIWIAASKERSDCESVVQELQNKGFSADIYVTTEWSNLNPEKWYVVTAGIYSTQEEADRVLPNIQAAGYDDAYVKYSGKWIVR